MLQIEFRPSLSECIETLAKREYQESIRSCLSSIENSKQLQERAELLRLFLESADFKKLRAQSEKWLSQGKEVKFMVSLKKGKLRTELVVE